MSEMSISQAVTNVVKDFRQTVPDCVAAGIVDMSTGMLLAVDTVDSHPSEVLDLLAAATFDMFQGRNVVMIEEIFNKRRGIERTGHYFREILVNSENLVHLFMRGTATDDMVAVVVCRRSVNIGMLFAQARLVMRSLDTSFGG
ncbi:hypothetical protein GCM10022251_18100 [Phytohabitans flavus]|uniref:Roadblock/LAMTOR2 domain-containing protein n=2 Tax=Phytohabitans flavus TaxID=1076124 RepID=A0A6F8Y5X3_9ACTN|nr:hypothetical protein [Phytohabitans flavus]BCB81423.1 hypothetical protein Pflav_078330 [Phytohabitans flavus]